jgi:hypothetical protein
MSSFPEAEKAALDFLKGNENPFDSLARPQRLDDCFVDVHVPELLAEDRKLLLELIDRYRVDEYAGSGDLYPTRVVVVLGDRGAGKTHLLQSLAYRTDSRSQLLVRPSHFERNLPFEEYLLGQLMATLAAEDDVYHSRPIEDIAAALSRRLLRQSLRALGPTERLFAISPSSWGRTRSFFGGGKRDSEVLDRLIAALDQPDRVTSLPRLIDRHGLDRHLCVRLILGHLSRHDPGPDLLAVLRRTLYGAMAQTALLDRKDPLFSLVGGEYGDIGTTATTRSEIVGRLLHVVTEVCALVRQPVVFAFDNLERLFSPQNAFDGELIRAFFNSLAQAIDNTRGLLVLLFAESGLFDRAAPFMDEFARHRLEQGVPIYGRGPINIVRLAPPGAGEIKTLIKNRVGAVLGERAASLPQLFPFDAVALEKATTGSQALRNTLLRLRNEYSSRVYERRPPEVVPTPAGAQGTTVAWESLLETHWYEQFKAAGRKLDGNLASNLKNLHAGLGALLQQVIPLSLDAWQLTAVQSTATVGDNPNYGVVSLLSFEPQPGSGDNGKPVTVGVALLLAKGTGMQHDLRSKFDFFRRPRKGDRLLVLWSTSTERDDLVEALPAATRTVWTESRHKSQATLRRVNLDELCTILAFQEWLNAVQAAAEQPVPPEVVQSFLKERFQSVLQLIAPPLGQEERVAANED